MRSGKPDLKPGLPATAAIPDLNIQEFETLDSTNAYVLREFSQLPDKTTVTALCQTAGRGRLNRAWLSEGKGLYFTIAVKPREPGSFAFANLPQLLCVSVCAALADGGLEPVIKWPNDILCGGGKLAGVLAEAVVVNGKLTGAALGAGINLYQDASDFGGLLYPAVSTAMLGKPVAGRRAFLEKILRSFYARYAAFERAGFQAISGEYNKYFAVSNRSVTLTQDGLEFSGTVKGVDEQGRLLLEAGAGMKTFIAGDLR